MNAFMENKPAIMDLSNKRLALAREVILQKVGEEAVLLDLNTKEYYSLNPSGLRMLQVLRESASMEQAVTSLGEEYAVDPAVLRGDLEELVTQLLKAGLVEII
jgi:hypothetical protein